MLAPFVAEGESLSRARSGHLQVASFQTFGGLRG